MGAYSASAHRPGRVAWHAREVTYALELSQARPPPVK